MEIIAHPSMPVHTPVTIHTHATAYNPYAWDYPDPRTNSYQREPFDECGFLSTLIRVSYHVSFTFGGFLTFLLLYLVFAKSKGPLKPFSRMLGLCSITDLFYWFTDNMIQVKAKLQDGVFMVKLEGPAQYFSYETQALFMAFYVIALSLIHSILPAQHYYRYYAVSRSEPLGTVPTIILYSLAVIVATPMGFIAYPAYLYAALERPGFNYGTLWYREVPLPQVLYADIRSIYQKGYFFYASLVVGGSYLFSLYFAYKTVKYLQRNSDIYTERTRSMQSQLSKALFFQTLLPVFVSVGPIMAICVPSFFYVDTGYSALIFMSIVSWVPTFNPLLTILAIVPYRNVVVRLFSRNRVSEASSADQLKHTDVMAIMA